ncbi:hypothetical protein AWW66_22905 [Micromonospora rosaria]|uniref:Methyl-accepting transducer domain-containing protein n=1 Tax=Micromonospora rosaria TaxID=47874 RepID=A0A136PMV0_9ACTN|nr:DUF6244 family protein [Micromonospora rosaria]KXK59688.1 hypothetical protein AWW66_22905 [Micromonospora rosaria]
MSSIEEITGELRALTTGVERARSLTAAAGSQAEQVAVRAAGAGFAAVAAGIAQVRAAISTIQGGLGSLTSAVEEATTATARVSRETTPQETITALAPAGQGVAATREAATATIAHVDHARQLAGAVLQGGQPGPLLQALDSIKQVLVLVVQRGTVAQQSVEAAISQARRLGSAGD